MKSELEQNKLGFKLLAGNICIMVVTLAGDSLSILLPFKLQGIHKVHQQKCILLEETYWNLRLLELLDQAVQAASSNGKDIGNVSFFVLGDHL